MARAKIRSRSKVRKIMTKPFIAGRPDIDLEEATRLIFERQIKKLSLADQGRLLGLITSTDVARFQPQMIRILKKLSNQVAAPKRLKKTMHYYLV